MELETTKLEASDPLLSVGVILDFQPIEATIRVNQYADESLQPSIFMPLKLRSQTIVRTPEERELNAITWSLTIHRGKTANEDLVTSQAIGRMNYFSSREHEFVDIPESSHLWAHLEDRSFDLLTQSVLAGHVPTNVRVDVKGLKWGWEPDGSAVVWDIAKGPNATITHLEMALATISGQDDADKEQASLQGRRPVTAEDLQRFRDDLVSTMAVGAKTLASRGGWIIVVVAALVAATVLRHP